MWCANCRAEVAAEVDEHNRRIRCTTCASELGVARSQSPEQNARELLERWTKTPLPEVPRPVLPAQSPLDALAEPPADPATVPLAARRNEGVAPRANDEAEPHVPPAPILRIDDSHEFRRPAPHAQPRAPQQPAESSRAANSSSDPDPRRKRSRRNRGRTHAPRPATKAREPARPRPNWQSLVGQCLAYLGVGGLTLGTSLAVWSYFGGMIQYAATGWLVMTAGQMLLFLGVITLVSGGLEGAVAEMSRRFDELSDRLEGVEARVSQETSRESRRRGRGEAA